MPENEKAKLLNIIYELDKIKENSENVKDNIYYLHNNLMTFLDGI